MPAAAPDLSPPPSGIYGLPLTPRGNEMHEELPDGGYILWQIQKDSQGKNDWRPVKYIEPEKGTLT